jgi:hypothetical protein
MCTGAEIALGAMVLGSTAATAYSAHKQGKAQERAMKKAAEEAEKNKVVPTITDNSTALEAARKRLAGKRGAASTVLAGDYRQSAAKRLLGE